MGMVKPTEEEVKAARDVIERGDADDLLESWAEATGHMGPEARVQEFVEQWLVNGNDSIAEMNGESHSGEQVGSYSNRVFNLVLVELGLNPTFPE